MLYYETLLYNKINVEISDVVNLMYEDAEPLFIHNGIMPYLLQYDQLNCMFFFTELKRKDISVKQIGEYFDVDDLDILFSNADLLNQMTYIYYGLADGFTGHKTHDYNYVQLIEFIGNNFYKLDVLSGRKSINE